jgi:hypothetical protein
MVPACVLPPAEMPQDVQLECAQWVAAALSERHERIAHIPDAVAITASGISRARAAANFIGVGDNLLYAVAAKQV